MPCAVLARGIRQTPPHTSPSPFVDAINNSPCGRGIVSTANGVSFAAQNCCLFHLKLRVGQQDVQAPYVFAA
jgi:hypothetical protein